MSKASSAAYRSQHLEEVRAKDRVRGRARWLVSKEKMVEANKLVRRRIRIELLAAYGGRCECCGESRAEFLAIDHIHGGGLKERNAIKKRGAEFHRWLRAQGYPRDKYRILCHNCNQARAWYAECPHERERRERCG